MRVQKVFFNGAEGKKTVQHETENLVDDLHWLLNPQAKIVFIGKRIINLLITRMRYPLSVKINMPTR